MRWREKTRASWIQDIGELCYHFSPYIELIDFDQGVAQFDFIPKAPHALYSEDWHRQLQEKVDRHYPGVAIFFAQEGIDPQD